MTRGAIAVLFVLFIVSVAQADTILVPKDQPTIQAGIDAAKDGDMVDVSPGTYVENIDFKGKAILVRCLIPTEAVIDGNDSGSVVTFKSNESEKSIISGFTLRKGKSKFIEKVGRREFTIR